jgi:proteasome lid subunit RPN8/RPN11
VRAGLKDAPERYAARTLARLRGACEEDPAREACGVVLRGPAGEEVVRLANAAPDPRRAYALDPAALLACVRAAEEGGARLVAFWHSHVEAPAVLSAADRDGALADGAPLWPGTEQLVVEIRAGRAVRVARYRFTRGTYEAEALEA